MLTVGAYESFHFQPTARKHKAQMYNLEYGLEQDETQRKTGINVQDAFRNRTHKTTHSNGNVHIPHNPSWGKSGIETHKLVCPTIDNMEPVSERTVMTRPGATGNEGVNPYQSRTVNISRETDDLIKNSAINTGKIPQRPQDLIDKVSFGVAKVNLKSSAQYRKSYAFKIWREKGCFPYRLADEPSTQERKRSKKYLNALKAERDRQNEEAWRAFKSLKAISQEKNAQRPTRRKSKEKEVGKNVEEQRQCQINAPTIPEPQEEITKARQIVHQNSIPHYFKSKKDASQKLPQLSKSIPTSVIHANTTKTCENSKSFLQIEREFTKAVAELSAKDVSKTDVTNSIRHAVITGGNTESAGHIETSMLGTRPTSSILDEESTPVLASNLDQLCLKETSSWNPSKTFDVQISKPECTVVSTISSFPSEKKKTLKISMNTSSSAQIPRQYPTEVRSVISLERYPGIESTRSANDLANQADKKTGRGAENIDSSSIGNQGQCNSAASVTCTAPAEVQEEIRSRSPSYTSNLAVAMKNTLNKKHCKENVRPDPKPDCIPNRKRRSQSSDEDLQNLPGKSKQRKLTVFAQLDEKVATNLADGIHSVNSEYFPINALANKAAQETSDTTKDQTSEKCLEKKVEEIGRVRLLLKELFDVTLESGEDHEMKTFDVASRSFGRKNILNHLSLLDRYFAEFQKKLSTEVSSGSSKDFEKEVETV